MKCRERLERYLSEYGIRYSIEEHPAAFTAQQVAASEHVSGWTVAKVVIVLANGALRMVVLPAPERLDLAKARAALGAKAIRLASEAEFAPLFGDCDAGAMPPFGNLYRMPVYVDETLTRQKEIVFQAGTHTTTMRLRYADFAKLADPIVADLSQQLVTA